MNEQQQRLIWLLRHKPAEQPVMVRHPKPIKPTGFALWYRRHQVQPPKPKPRHQPAPQPKVSSVKGFVLVRERGGEVARCERCWLGFVGHWAEDRMIAHQHTHTTAAI